jgi:hypothetical protein
MPTINFSPRGHKDSNDERVIDTNVWNIPRFESLRGRIHHPLSRNSGYQKAMMDVSKIPKKHTIFRDKRIESVHLPMKRGQKGRIGCNALIKDPNFDDVNMYPLATNHYTGTLEQFLFRNDTQRDAKQWEKRAQMNGNRDDGWIRGWLQSFVEEHGLQKVSQVLRDYHTKQ